MDKMTKYLYLIHFADAFHHARHYTGITVNLKTRLYQHANGIGARLTQVLFEQNKHWMLAAVWTEATRANERFIKNQHGAKPFCPICSPLHRKAPKPAIWYPITSIPFPTTSIELKELIE